MPDSRPRHDLFSTGSVSREKWRSAVILTASVLVVFVILKLGASQIEHGAAQAGSPPAASESSTPKLLIASAALVGTVLGFAGGTLLLHRRRTARRNRLVIYDGAETPSGRPRPEENP